MDFAVGALVAFLGFACGIGSFNGLMRWIAVIYSARQQVLQTARDAPLSRVVGLAVAQSAFHAGPYTVITLALVAYYVRGEAWAPWAFTGFGVGLGVMVLLVVPFLLKYSRSRPAREEGDLDGRR